MPSLTERVKQEARRLGFELVGVTTPQPPPHLSTYNNWISQGRHGEMHYLSRPDAMARRADPLAILPECRSILALGIPYKDPGRAGTGSKPGRGLVAAYAWGQDYHDLLKPRLEALVAFLERQVGGPVPNRWYTDTGPILERDFAQQAGLGWTGKNTCLIHPHAGSYFILAEILLGIALEPDASFHSDHCGTCARCIEICPTDCILPDRTLDSRRCIAYLTIELKGPIPIDLRPQIGSWVFGCDLCQQVCPWNIRFAGADGDAGFEPQDQIREPILVNELALTPAAFNTKFKGSPVKRTKRRGYLRNVAVALGNQGDPAAVPMLGQSLAEEVEPLIRAHAAWALGKIGGREAELSLQRCMKHEIIPEVRTEIQAAIEGSGCSG